jgi:zinc/manganese transport system permease protein
MFPQEFMRNALVAGTPVAIACAVGGWFVVLRGQLFAGDALSHVAFPGALAAASVGIDQRLGLLTGTVIAAVLIAVLGRGSLSLRGGRSGSMPSDDTAIGVAFTFILGLGLFFLTRYGMSSSGSGGIQAARTLFGSIFGLGAGEARLTALVAVVVVLALGAIARPLLFASIAPDVAAARGVRTRLLDVVFLVALGVIAAAATQAVGALLLLGLLAGPAATAHNLARSPGAGIAIAVLVALLACWGGLALAYAIPSLPPSSAIVFLAGAGYYLSTVASRTAVAGGRPQR